MQCTSTWQVASYSIYYDMIRQYRMCYDAKRGFNSSLSPPQFRSCSDWILYPPPEESALPLRSWQFDSWPCKRCSKTVLRSDLDSNFELVVLQASSRSYRRRWARGHPPTGAPPSWLPLVPQAQRQRQEGVLRGGPTSKPTWRRRWLCSRPRNTGGGCSHMSATSPVSHCQVVDIRRWLRF